MKKFKGVIILSFLIALCLSGCGVKVSNKSPESVVKSIVKAYQKQDEKAVKKCFGIDAKKKAQADIKTEIDYNMKLFKAREANDIEITACKSLGNFNGSDLVYIIYNYELKDEKAKKSEVQKAPAISMFYVKEKDKKYYIMPAKDITDKLIGISEKEYEKFMKTEVYKVYANEYKKFVRENPGYEESIGENLK